MILVAMLIILLDNPGQKSEHMSSHLISFLHFLLISFKIRLKFDEHPRADPLGGIVHSRQLRIGLSSEADNVFVLRNGQTVALLVVSGLDTLGICVSGETTISLVDVYVC